MHNTREQRAVMFKVYCVQVTHEQETVSLYEQDIDS